MFQNCLKHGLIVSATLTNPSGKLACFNPMSPFRGTSWRARAARSLFSVFFYFLCGSLLSWSWSLSPSTSCPLLFRLLYCCRDKSSTNEWRTLLSACSERHGRFFFFQPRHSRRLSTPLFHIIALPLLSSCPKFVFSHPPFVVAVAPVCLLSRFLRVFVLFFLRRFRHACRGQYELNSPYAAVGMWFRYSCVNARTVGRSAKTLSIDL